MSFLSLSKIWFKIADTSVCISYVNLYMTLPAILRNFWSKLQKHAI